PRQRIDEDDVLRYLETSELAAAVLDQLLRGSGRVRPQGDEGNGGFAPSFVGAPDDGRFENSVVLVEHALHLGAGDVLTARQDHVLEPVDDVEVPVVVPDTDVS